MLREALRTILQNWRGRWRKAGCLFVTLLAWRWATVAAAESPFNVDTWGTADGLPEGTVVSLAQTPDGYLWLGTLNGLVRFDGTTFTRFNVNNTPNLPGNKVVFLYADRETNLWVGTSDGQLCRLKEGVIMPLPRGPERAPVRFATERSDGTLWFCTDRGQFFAVAPGMPTPQPIAAPDSLYYQVFHLRVPGRDGVEWSLQNGRVAKYQNGQLVHDYGPVPWKDSTIFARIQQSDGSYVQASFDQQVVAAAVDADGNLAVGTPGDGVYWFGPEGRSHHLGEKEGLSNNYVLSLCPDRDGNIWVGTDPGGINRLSPRVFQSPPELAVGSAFSLAEDARGALWSAFNLRGLIYYQTNAVRSYGSAENFHAWTVLVDDRQTVWAGTTGQGAEGLFRLGPDGFVRVPEAAAAGTQIFALYQDRAGRVWVGGQNALGAYDGTNWTWYGVREGLPPASVRSMAQDAAGNLWVASGTGGLYEWVQGRFVPAATAFKDCSYLLAGQSGVLWAGTEGHGLAWLVDGQWHQCSSFNGLLADDVGYLLEDSATNLWVGTFEGLMRLDEASLFAAAQDPTRKVSERLFLTQECPSGVQPAALRTRTGQLWFPTVQGVVGLNPKSLHSDPVPPPVVIESILVDDVPQKASRLSSQWPERVTIPPTAEQVAIQFTSLNFSAPKNLHAQLGARFRWRLGSREVGGNWTEAAGGERAVHFNHLSPGEYHFQVTACNEDGVWNPTGASVWLLVQPPFWKTSWFLTLVAVALIGSLAGTIYLLSTDKLKRQLRTLHQKELVEKERARIARDLHDQLGANLTQVALLGEMAEADKDLPGEVEQHAQQICATARETTHALDEIVWAINPQNDTLEGLANYACKYAQDYFALAGVSFRPELPPLPNTPILPEVRHNVFLAFKEAVNNVVKHSGATEARVRLQLEPGRFVLSIIDNGRGLGDISGKSTRNGLRNMNRRLADIRGEFNLTAGAQGGTVVQLTVPLGRPPV